MIWIPHTLPLAALALLTERAFGYPQALQRTVGHPVQWMGATIGALEACCNRPQLPPRLRRLAGVLAMLLLLLLWGGAAWLLHVAITSFLPSTGWIVEGLLASALLAQRSLREHVRAIIDALPAPAAEQDLRPARRALSRIVGRDTEAFDESDISHAAIESLAENTSDGIVAPLFWLALAGLPGIVVYKLVNTADSMIGHLNERYRHFGWAAARLDDVLNWLPARLTGLLLALARRDRLRDALRIMWRDASRHVSPNAGWPESAMAAVLDIRLGGPRSYDGRLVLFPWLGEGRARLARTDIEAALKLYDHLLNILAVAISALAVIALVLF